MSLIFTKQPRILLAIYLTQDSEKRFSNSQFESRFENHVLQDY